MSIRYFKGQGIIAEIILFAVSIFLALMVTIILSVDDSEFNESVSAEIEGSMENVRDRSSLTVMLNDNVDSVNDVDNAYSQVSAIELTSYYFSTSEDIHLYGSTYDRDEVRDDLKAYYRQKLAQYSAGSQEYHLNITDPDDNYIEVDETTEEHRERWNSVSVPLHLSNGETGEIKIYIGGTGGSFNIE